MIFCQFCRTLLLVHTGTSFYRSIYVIFLVLSDVDSFLKTIIIFLNNYGLFFLKGTFGWLLLQLSQEFYALVLFGESIVKAAVFAAETVEEMKELQSQIQMVLAMHLHNTADAIASTKHHHHIQR